MFQIFILLVEYIWISFYNKFKENVENISNTHMVKF